MPVAGEPDEVLDEVFRLLGQLKKDQEIRITSYDPELDEPTRINQGLEAGAGTHRRSKD
jgi:hypothetical protein